jgi:hypothetical protein
VDAVLPFTITAGPICRLLKLIPPVWACPVRGPVGPLAGPSVAVVGAIIRSILAQSC